MVTALQFRQVLENFCARLSDKQFRYMLSKLELDCESCSVKWKDFLNKFKSQSPPVRDQACEYTEKAYRRLKTTFKHFIGK